MVDNSQAATTRWTARDIQVLLVLVTACLCLVILVSGTLILLATGVIDAKDLGGLTSLGVGSGLVGMGAVIVWALKIALKPRGNP